MSSFSSRIARSRYFSWISSSVAGKLTPSLAAMWGFFDGPRRRSSRVHHCVRRAGRLAPAPDRAGRLQQLERLDVDEVLVLADDVGVAHRLQELLGPVEVVDADHHAPEALSDVAVGAGARDDPVLGGEALGLLVERGERDPRVEHLEDVDLLDHVEQVLVVGDRVEAVEGVRDVDQPALAADLGDRLCHRHPPRDLLLQEQPDHLALLGRLHLLRHDHPHVAPLLRQLARRQRTGDLVVVGDRDRPEPALLRGIQEHVDRGRAVRRVVGVHVEVDVDRRPIREPAPHGRLAGGVVAARADAPVDLLDLVGHHVPVASGALRARQEIHRSGRARRSGAAPGPRG